MEFRIPEKKKLKIWIDEKCYEYSKPTMKMAEEFGEEVEGLSDKDKAIKTKEYVAKCGIPLDVLQDLDTDQFTALMEAIQSTMSKKN